MTDRKFGEPIVGEQNRKFESVENALTFVMQDLMQDLSWVDRQTVLIQTDYRSLHLVDIEERYVGMVLANPAGVFAIAALDQSHD